MDALKQCRFDSAVSAICTLYPRVNIALAAEVMISFQAVVNYLMALCHKSSVCTEPFLRVVFSSLKDALNLRTDAFEKYFTFFPSKDDNGYLSILVEKCRQKIMLLPSVDIVRDSMIACTALFIELQITKFSSDDSEKELNLLHWSTAHMQRYTDISNWEFCMCIDSPLSIHMLLALATTPELEPATAENMNNAFFPWICGIQKILEGYLNYSEDLSSGSINYLFYYSNLKEYENRIAYFISRFSRSKPADKAFCRTAVKLLLALYITQPQASEGMNIITSKSLYAAGGKGMWLYKKAMEYLRSRGRF